MGFLGILHVENKPKKAEFMAFLGFAFALYLAGKLFLG
jgi:hypothetical protein